MAGGGKSSLHSDIDRFENLKFFGSVGRVLRVEDVEVVVDLFVVSYLGQSLPPYAGKFVFEYFVLLFRHPGRQEV